MCHVQTVCLLGVSLYPPVSRKFHKDFKQIFFYEQSIKNIEKLDLLKTFFQSLNRIFVRKNHRHPLKQYQKSKVLVCIGTFHCFGSSQNGSPGRVTPTCNFDLIGKKIKRVIKERCFSEYFSKPPSAPLVPRVNPLNWRRLHVSFSLNATCKRLFEAALYLFCVSFVPLLSMFIYITSSGPLLSLRFLSSFGDYVYLYCFKWPFIQSVFPLFLC